MYLPFTQLTCTPASLVKVNSTIYIWSIKSDRVNLVEPASPCGTVQSGTGKVDPARKFKLLQFTFRRKLYTVHTKFKFFTWLVYLQKLTVKTSNVYLNKTRGSSIHSFFSKVEIFSICFIIVGVFYFTKQIFIWLYYVLYLIYFGSVSFIFFKY